MSDISRLRPTTRFNGLAALYARCRPTYPDTAIDFIIAHCALGPDALVLDVGSGTGIASRLFASRGIRVVGIEPNVDMRAQAEHELVPAPGLPPSYRDGRAETTGLAPGSVNTIVVAQAFHWFDPGPTLAEFHRILKPGGWVALMWNDHDVADTVMVAYDELSLTVPDAAAVDATRSGDAGALLASYLFTSVERRIFPNAQTLDLESFLGRAFSASWAPREAGAAGRYEAGLSQIFTRFERQGRVTLRYRTAVYIGQRVQRWASHLWRNGSFLS
jgi:SAM-dependent methyltransferase